MSFVYSSNSPEFLNYVAHTKTRNDILNDPKLCVLLEDPHIKDNMELALLYRDAQYGDYEAKKEFIGFFLANGPELDTDTIMHFREKILHNPTYTQIYKSEFGNNTIHIIDTLRITKYGKHTTDTDDSKNCLQNPCDYLGPFSSSIGLMGDDKNFNTLSNMFARLNEKTSNSEEGDSNKDTSSRIWGSIPQHMISKIVPNLEKAYRTVLANMSASWDEFAKKVESTGGSNELKTVGDPKAEERAKEVSSAIKVNIVSNLGDCSRIWENMRRLRVYDPSKNAKKPFEQISNKTVDGAVQPNYTPRSDVDLQPTPIGTRDAQSGTSNVSAEPSAPEQITINSLDNRYKQTYSIYKYMLDTKADQIDEYDKQIMQEFIDEIDAYIKDQGAITELPRLCALSKNYQSLEAGWTRDYGGYITD